MCREKVYIFIEESGDFGMKHLIGSSRFVVVVALVFKDIMELERCKLDMQNLKLSLKLSNKFEFKFSKLNNKIRKIVLSKLGTCHCDIYYACQDKNNFIGTSVDLYFHMYRDLLKKLSILDHSIYIEIDGVLDRRKKEETISFLRKILGKNRVKITFVNSKNSPLIQFADMIAGSVRIFHEFSNNDFIHFFKKNIK